MSLVRYFIAHVLPDLQFSEAETLKLALSELCNSKGALRSPAHITLHMPFEWKEEKEEELIRSLEKLRPKAPVAIHLDGFGHFDDRVIFMAVRKNSALEEWHRDIAEHMKRHHFIFNEVENKRAFHPHVTLAFRDLKKEGFIKGWEWLHQKHCSHHYETTSFCLLKHDGKRWQIHHQF